MNLQKYNNQIKKSQTGLTAMQPSQLNDVFIITDTDSCEKPQIKMISATSPVFKSPKWFCSN